MRLRKNGAITMKMSPEEYQRNKENLKRAVWATRVVEGSRWEVPDGWIDLTYDLLMEIYTVLKEKGTLDDYHLSQAKEKFGKLRWYDNCDDEDVQAIVKRYEKYSAHTCVRCGEPAEFVSIEYISPWCARDMQELDKAGHGLTFEYIDEFYE